MSIFPRFDHISLQVAAFIHYYLENQGQFIDLVIILLLILISTYQFNHPINALDISNPSTQINCQLITAFTRKK